MTTTIKRKRKVGTTDAFTITSDLNDGVTIPGP